MPSAPVCHISTGSVVTNQPLATRLPSIPAAIDLPSAIAAINALKLLVQLIAGQQGVIGAGGRPVHPGAFGGGGSVAGGARGEQGLQGQKGKEGKAGKEEDRFVEDRSKRVEKKKRIYQNNDKKSENWVDIMQINKVVWVDRVTGGKITWSR